jgi:hypothetical protein
LGRLPFILRFRHLPAWGCDGPGFEAGLLFLETTFMQMSYLLVIGWRTEAHVPITRMRHVEFDFPKYEEKRFATFCLPFPSLH